LPQSLPNATTAEVSAGANVILTSTNELKKASGAGFGPKFITPVIVINKGGLAGASGNIAASFNNEVLLSQITGTEAIPTTATALILETEIKQTGPDEVGNEQTSVVSTSVASGGTTYKIAACRSGGGGDSVANVCQATIPFNTSLRKFYWNLSDPMTGGYFITRVVGYY
jgi:hypothetical protein